MACVLRFEIDVGVVSFDETHGDLCVYCSVCSRPAYHWQFVLGQPALYVGVWHKFKVEFAEKQVFPLL